MEGKKWKKKETNESKSSIEKRHKWKERKEDTKITDSRFNPLSFQCSNSTKIWLTAKNAFQQRCQVQKMLSVSSHS